MQKPINIVLGIISLFLFQSVKAQKEDSVLVYMKTYGEMVKTKDSADYILKIMTPPDSSSGIKINRIKQYYPNNKLQLTGTAIINV